MGLLFSGYSVSAGEEEKLLEMNGGGGYTAKRMYLMPQNWRRGEHWGVETVRVKTVNFMLCIF